jgi:DNA replication and repair protein RecF
MHYVKSLYLRNFRNYAEAEITFSPGINLFHGDNAQGKTNLLEAACLITTGRSFRTARLDELIRFGQPFFFIEGIVCKDGFDHTVQIAFDGTTKKLTLDGNNYSTLQHLLGLLPSVLYAPSDSELIDGSPAIRRRFLNLHLAQGNPLYLHHLSRYWRAMKQRNSLLRVSDSSLDCWEIEMAESALYLKATREALIAAIQEPLRKRSSELSSGKEEHQIAFQPSTPPTAEAYLAQLKKNRPREKQLGATLTGPHRDDFTLSINGKESKGFCSEGQKKTTAFALKLAEWELFTKLAEAPALLAIDDFGLQLDNARLAHFGQTLRELGQVFITSPHACEHLPKTKLIEITNGNLTCKRVELDQA